MDRGVTLHEMESMAIGMDGPDFTKEIGNIINISDSNDALGLGMLANPGRQRGNNGSAPSNPEPPALAEVEIGNLSTMEPISFNLGGPSLSGPQMSAPIEIQFSKAEEERSSGSLFSNMQTSTAPGFSLASAPTPRMDPEKERKEKSELIAKLLRLEQKGFPVSKRYTMDNTLEEMNQEFNRLVDARNLEASVKFQRQALMSVVTGLEWANSR